VSVHLILHIVCNRFLLNSTSRAIDLIVLIRVKCIIISDFTWVFLSQEVVEWKMTKRGWRHLQLTM
jgi:hypothetical protein